MNAVDGKKIRFWEDVDGIIVIGAIEDENGPRHVVLEPHWKSDDPGLPGHETITLEDIALQFPDNGCLTVLAERPLEGHIYRYNNYGEKEWLEVGTTCGYA